MVNNLNCDDVCSVQYDPLSDQWLWSFRIDADDRTRLSFIGTSQKLEHWHAKAEPLSQLSLENSTLGARWDKVGLHKWLSNSSHDSGLAMFAWPTADMFALHKKLEEQQFLQQRVHDRQSYMSLKADSRVTMLPAIYKVDFIPYESSMLVLLTYFLGRRKGALHVSAADFTSISIVDVGVLTGDLEIAGLPDANRTHYQPLVGYLDQPDEHQYVRSPFGPD